jgi:Bacterial PH domain
MWGQPPPAVRRSANSAAAELTMSVPIVADPNSTETFAASRWTQGNFLFPTKLTINAQRVARVKSRFFGSNEESIPMSKVASVHISTGVFWAEIVIESTGGTDPITSHGHRKADAQRIRDLIESYQTQARS